MYMYISLWDHNKAKSKGISIYDLNSETGELTFIKTVRDDAAFNYSIIDSEKNVMYINNEAEHIPDTPHTTGRVFVFDLDPKTGEPTERGRKITYCPSPCHFDFDSTGKYIVVANHSDFASVTKLRQNEEGKWEPYIVCNDAAVQLFAMNEDGTIGDLLDVKFHTLPEYTFDNAGHANNCHPHSALRAPGTDLFCVADKGDGYVYMYALENEKLVLKSRVMADTPTCKPRVCVYHPTKPYIFVNHEGLSGQDITMTSLKYDTEGNLEVIGNYKVVDEIPDYSRVIAQQEIAISADGKYVYTMLRNPASVAVMEVNEETGALKLLQNAPVSGEHARALGLSPDGRYVVTGALSTGEVAVFSVGEDGLLTDTGFTAEAVGASFINFYDPKN